MEYKSRIHLLKNEVSRRCIVLVTFPGYYGPCSAPYRDISNQNRRAELRITKLGNIIQPTEQKKANNLMGGSFPGDVSYVIMISSQKSIQP
jgi:hypothetical protein